MSPGAASLPQHPDHLSFTIGEPSSGGCGELGAGAGELGRGVPQDAGDVWVLCRPGGLADQVAGAHVPADWSSNGRLSAVAATHCAAPAGRCARMTADGSTAVTSRSEGS
jgi:hypothetical protein